ncbi:c-type cytochrome [Marinobacter sp. SS21]|uniref:c-type cytochrome n=1 Tax=Marinobacter sp. SS21 TaxID=2979460 RepID=UPI00232D425C|nr:c-type cytochrome [Marinobacter sp. SS21]MDC0662681.1 c-type cytochrome [Marinobacter sp. SS21]
MRRAIVVTAILAMFGAVALGALIGPDLWAGYQFMKVVDQQTTAYEANGGAWPQLQDTCALCHGQNGQAANAHYPSLAGLSASYIENQLHAFAEGRRPNPQMQPLAKSLSDEQIRMLAAYYERQSPAANDPLSANASLDPLGQTVVETRGCATCHGGQFQGSPMAPRLAGQGEYYLVDQLQAFKASVRQDPTQAMNGIASTLSEAEIQAAASYLASLTPADSPAQ